MKVTGDKLTRPIYWRGWQWAITAFGVEALDGTYPIKKQRLWENEGQTWEDHMAEKEWVDRCDFNEAIAKARICFDKLKPRA